MRKTRLASLLLSLSLALTCLPLSTAAAASSDETVTKTIDATKYSNSSEGGKPGTFTASMVPSADADGENRYLCIYNRYNNNTGIQISGLSLDTSKTYVLTFKIRTYTVTNGLGKSYELTTPYIRLGSGFKTETSGGKTTKYYTNISLVGDKSGEATSISDAWQEYAIEFLPKNASPTLQINAYSNWTYSYPIEIDDIKIVEKGSTTPLLFVDFENYDGGRTFKYNQIYAPNDSHVVSLPGYDNVKIEKMNPTNAGYEIKTEQSYHYLDVANKDSLEIKLSDIIGEVKPGTYTYSIKLRNGEFNATADKYVTMSNNNITARYNTYTAKAQVKAGETVLAEMAAADVVTVGEDWTELTYTFEVEHNAATLPDTLAIALTHTVADHETIKAQFKDATLTFVPSRDPAVEAVEALISAIGTVTLDSATAINAALDAYDALNADQKADVQNHSVLTTAKAQYDILKARKDKVDAVIRLINTIGEVTLESESAIATARAKYDALSDSEENNEKARVTNYATLVAAEATLAAMKDAPEDAIVIPTDSYVGAATVLPEDGGSYLSVTGRGNNLAGIVLRFDTTVGEQYTVTYNARYYSNKADRLLSSETPKIRALAKTVSNNNYSVAKDFGTTWTPYKMTFTAAADHKQLEIYTFGNGTHRYPFDIDDIVVIKGNDTENPIVDLSFEKGEAQIGSYAVLGNAVVTKEQEALYGTFTSEDGAALTVARTDELVPGTYTYKIKLRNGYFNANYTDNTLSAYAKITTTNGKTYGSASRAVTVSDGWTECEYTFNIREATTLEKLEIYASHNDAQHGTAPVYVHFKDASLTYSEDTGGELNAGILMVLLAKKRAAQNDDEPTAPVEPETVGYIENGTFTKPVTLGGTITAGQTEAEAGWYARLTDSSKTTVKQVTERNNTFLRVENVTSGQRGVYFNTGVVLQPGTYTLSAYLRVSESAAESSLWSDAQKSTMQMRINLHDPANPNSPHYAANDGVDSDTTYDALGNAVGTLTTVSREWTHYTDTIVVDKPTLAVFKIGGGIGGAVDAHGFDIDNISLTDGVNDYTLGVPVESDVVIPEPDDSNYIVNGDFSVEPSINAGSHNAAVTDTWFRNSGMGYQRGSDGAALTDKPKIMYEMNLTWTDGYMTLTGREWNLTPVSITPGKLLEAGTYRFSIDYKTANEGETTVNRVYIFTADRATRLFDPGSKTVSNVTNKWTTYSFEFTVDSPTAIRIELAGGPNASYTHDYCFDNVVLEKID